MAMWRPISGSILILDPALATIADVEEYLTERRIIARAAASGDDTYHLEVGVTGRRRRVACLDDDGNVAAGPSLAELVESMDNALRKLQIDIGGRIAWGDIDLGEVDIEGDDYEPEGALLQTVREPDAVDRLDAADRPEAADRPDAAGSPEGDEVDDDIPGFGQGPMVALSDISFAVLPGAAASLETELAAFHTRGATAVIADTVPPQAKSMVGNSNFVIALSADSAGLDAPVFLVRAGGLRLTWNWTDRLQPLPWVAASAQAMDFVESELGVGAFTSRIAQWAPEVDAGIVRLALIGHPSEAPARLAAAFGLPSEVADCLNGLLPARVIPGAIVFEPKPFGARLQSSVAHAVAGERPSDAGLWKMYRKVDLERPRLTEVLASVQAGVGVAALAGGLRSWRRTAGKVVAVLGGALVVNAAARILTLQWVGKALETEGLSVSPRVGEVGDADVADVAGDAGGVAGETGEVGVAGDAGVADDAAGGGRAGEADGRTRSQEPPAFVIAGTQAPADGASGGSASGETGRHAKHSADSDGTRGAAVPGRLAHGDHASGVPSVEAHESFLPSEAPSGLPSGATGDALDPEVAPGDLAVETPGSSPASDASGSASASEAPGDAPAPEAAAGTLSSVPEPDRAAVEAFWTRARNVGRIAPLEAVMGQDDVSSLCPPVFSFGDTPELADELAQLVLAGKKTATSGWLASYEASGVELPSVGDLSIMCDGRGRPRALLSNTDVAVVGFQQAGPEVSDAEGEGDFEYWKSAHEEFFARECAELGIDFDPQGSIVVEYFKVLYSPDGGHAGVTSGRAGAAHAGESEAAANADEAAKAGEVAANADGEGGAEKGEAGEPR